ncbi:harpin binding protein 1 [Dunaliella salina]|uniref:Harpin binding protein 1 n=1 Tax=Dunaliella salina TaxID=3046 RepID=A0ABQ7H729_DUNSA|nr:harpin binding protein 1 [Dunaliella salina]|eukprot:KAF5842663.1 harpin binding protein 1 [Dunaliella salina]
MQVTSRSLQSQLNKPVPSRKGPLRRGAACVHASAQTFTACPGQESVNMLRSDLLREVAGLDRGLAASASQAKRVEALVQEIADIAGRPDLSQENTADLQGMWRLLYTSGFNTGSLGGSRPGPPAGLVPAVLGQIFQRIDAPTIVFEDTSAEIVGGLSFLPKVTTPALPEFMRPSRNLRSAKFEVLYLDDDFRITRGDRGELRIYAKEKLQ